MTEHVKGTIDARVYYEDTDAGMIIYHANYLKYAERGRTELLRSLGYDHKRVMDEFGIILVVRHIDIDFQAVGKLDDLLTVETRVSAIGNTSITMPQTVSRDGKILAEIKVVVVALNREGRAVRIPSQLRQLFGESTSES
jgi:acyl-CoA thioester hydrolase